jgi:DNA-binding XRE family transcriptional regulator
MTRVNDPVELGLVVRARRRELRETQQTIADVTGIHRASVRKLERGAGSVQLRIALMVMQTLGLNVEVMPRDAGARQSGDAGGQSCGGTRIAADVAALLRGALYTQLSRACEDAPGVMPTAQSRAGWADVLERIEGARTALDVIGWDTPAWQDIEVELDQTMIEALEDDVDSWEWLADAMTTESAKGRRQAAAKATTIRRFLASVKPSALVKRGDAEAKDGDA